MVSRSDITAPRVDRFQERRDLRENNGIRRQGRAIIEDYTVLGESLQFRNFDLDLSGTDEFGASNIDP
jgi:hypothetical protein